MPESFQKKYPDRMKNLRLNSRKLTTPFDIHETLKHFLNFKASTSSSSSSSSSSSKSFNGEIPRGISLFNYIPSNRTCKDSHIEAHWCSCLRWVDLNISSNLIKENDNNNINAQKNNKNNKAKEGDQLVEDGDYEKIKSNLTKRYSKSALRTGEEAVLFMNSLIDSDYKQYCHTLRLQSIEKISRLDVNLKVLAFMKSKDIHGREAIFDESIQSSNNKTFNNNTSFKRNSFDLDHLFTDGNDKICNENSTINTTQLNCNRTNARKNNKNNNSFILQIVLTTWPGNASYELSFRHQRINNNQTKFVFNKNEISRINTYSSAANCVVNKRPDLRQFCFCNESLK
jgi:hypothetical protein